MRLCSKSASQTRLRRQNGFTLLELAAVILIITILVSLLCAALNNTKSKALRLSCLDNMKQLQLAWTMYTSDYFERLPLNQEDLSKRNPKFPIFFSTTNSWVTGSPRYDTTTLGVRRGSLFPYVNSVGPYHCPLDTSTVAGHPEILRNRSYAMNAFLGGDPTLNPEPRMSFNDLINPRPENTFVFIEEHQNSIWASSFLVTPRSRKPVNASGVQLSWLSTPSDRHEQGCNITFADGHIEYWRWNAPKAEAGNPQITGSEIQDIRKLQATVPSL